MTEYPTLGKALYSCANRSINLPVSPQGNLVPQGSEYTQVPLCRVLPDFQILLIKEQIKWGSVSHIYYSKTALSKLHVVSISNKRW